MNTDLIAVVARGLEKVAAKEIRALGGGIGKTREDRGRVVFAGPADAVYRANLQLRTVERILVPGGPSFEAKTAIQFSKAARELPWERWIPKGVGVRVATTVRGCALYHTGLVAEAMREALVYRGLSGEPPEDGAPTIDVRGTGDNWVVCADSSGPSLHRRGYRKATAKAPLRETLAAALLLRAGWTGDRPFLDPMCGSGTLVAEAAGIATRRPPGLDRSFAFEAFPSMDVELWRAAVGRARSAHEARIAKPLPKILGADAAKGSVRAARSNLNRAGLGDVASIIERRIQDTPPAAGDPGLVVVNPPYGKRVLAGRDADSARGEWAAWGRILRERLPGWGVHALSPDKDLAAAAGATGRPLLRTSNGGIPVALVKLA